MGSKPRHDDVAPILSSTHQMEAKKLSGIRIRAIRRTMMMRLACDSLKRQPLARTQLAYREAQFAPQQ
jgi:hypothetical protein